MLVRHVMTEEVLCFRPDARCRAVLEAFRENEIRHAPVVQDGRLVGVVTERDLLRKLPSSTAELQSEAGMAAERSTLASVMTRDPRTTYSNEALDRVANRMLDARIGCLPVVDGKLVVGIVTTADILYGLAEVTRGEGERRVLLMSAAHEGQRATPAEICVVQGLRLVTLLGYRDADGRDYYLIGVRADEAEFERFVATAVQSGHLLLDNRPGHGERRSA